MLLNSNAAVVTTTLFKSGRLQAGWQVHDKLYSTRISSLTPAAAVLPLGVKNQLQQDIHVGVKS